MSPDLDAIRARIKEAEYKPDTGHSIACGCDACTEVWSYADTANAAREALLPDVHRLVVEVERLQRLLKRKTTACDEWITLANERRLALEALVQACKAWIAYVGPDTEDEWRRQGLQGADHLAAIKTAVAAALVQLPEMPKNSRFDLDGVKRKLKEARADNERHYAGDLDDLAACIRALEQTTHERVTLFDYVQALEVDVLRLEDALREKQA